MNLLKGMKDPRDNRGKRHELAFVLGCTILAIMSGRHKVSEIHRFIVNRFSWLQTLFTRPEAKPISRAQLPRILDAVDWNALNRIIETFFGFTLAKENDEWVSTDGKVLKGTITDKNNAHENEQIVTIVGHKSQEIYYQRKMSGAKSSEITEVRNLLKETGMLKAKITLDSLHSNPDTLEPINLAGGKYLVQIKENQPKLLEKLSTISKQETPEEIIETKEKGHGRHEERTGSFFSLEEHTFDKRWTDSNFQTLVVMDRETEEKKSGKESLERSYYISNDTLQDHEKELFTAIREHWHIESNHYIRDVTFDEDNVKTKDKNQAQNLSLLRTVAIKIIRKMNPKNFKKITEDFCDLPDFFKKTLLKFNFL